MKRIIAFLISLILLLSMSACISTPRDQKYNEPTTAVVSAVASDSTKSIADIYMEVVPLIKGSDFLEVDASRITELYDIKADLVNKAYIATFNINDAAFPGQIVLVEAVDEAAASEIFNIFNTKIADIKNQAESYDPVSFKIASECEPLKSGTKVALFFSDSFEEMSKIFAS